MNLTVRDLAGLAWAQVWQVTALAMAVACLARLCAHWRPHLAYLLWLLVIVKCLVPPIWASPTGIFSWTRAGGSLAPSTDEPVSDAVPAEPARGSFSAPARTSVRADLPAVINRPASIAMPMPATWLGLVWLGGLATCSTIAVRTWVGWLRVLRRSTLVADGPLALKVAELSARLRLRRKVQLRVTSSPVGPAVLGVLRPKLLMPEALVSSKSPRDLDPILAHELIHVRRGDAAAGAAQMLAQLLWWFHPLVWWANRAACLERERCCDEETVSGLCCARSITPRASSTC